MDAQRIAAAETALVGSALLSPDVACRHRNAIGSGAFEDPFLGRVWEAVAAMAVMGQPLDPVTVADRLASSPWSRARAEVTEQIAAMVASVPSSANADYYAAIVVNAAGKRHRRRAGARSVQ